MPQHSGHVSSCEAWAWAEVHVGLSVVELKGPVGRYRQRNGSKWRQGVGRRRLIREV